MATLNVKNVPDQLYGEVRKRAERNMRSVAQEVLHILSEAVEEPEPLSILDLKGLGRDLWRDVDPAEHVRRERDAWD
jgi:plasmid stability protein